jgi:hypothetical protein
MATWNHRGLTRLTLIAVLLTTTACTKPVAGPPTIGDLPLAKGRQLTYIFAGTQNGRPVVGTLTQTIAAIGSDTAAVSVAQVTNGQVSTRSETHQIRFGSLFPPEGNGSDEAGVPEPVDVPYGKFQADRYTWDEDGRTRLLWVVKPYILQWSDESLPSGKVTYQLSSVR